MIKQTAVLEAKILMRQARESARKTSPDWLSKWNVCSDWLKPLHVGFEQLSEAPSNPMCFRRPH